MKAVRRASLLFLGALVITASFVPGASALLLPVTPAGSLPSPVVPHTPVNIPATPPVEVPTTPPFQTPNAPNSPVSIPGTPPAKSVPPPVKTPAVPTPPASVSKPPPAKVPTVSSSPTLPAVHAPSSGASTGASYLGGGGRNSVQPTTGAGASAPTEAAHSSSFAVDQGGFGTPLESAVSPTSAVQGTSAEAIRADPLRRWFIYVWPAVALGPFGKSVASLITAFAGNWGGAYLSALNGARTPSAPRAAGGEHSSADPSSADENKSPIADLTSEGGGDIGLFILLLGLAGFVAVLVREVRRGGRSASY